jgi:hypothetical protein
MAQEEVTRIVACLGVDARAVTMRSLALRKHALSRSETRLYFMPSSCYQRNAQSEPWRIQIEPPGRGDGRSGREFESSPIALDQSSDRNSFIRLNIR